MYVDESYLTYYLFQELRSGKQQEKKQMVRHIASQQLYGGNTDNASKKIR